MIHGFGEIALLDGAGSKTDRRGKKGLVDCKIELEEGEKVCLVCEPP